MPQLTQHVVVEEIASASAFVESEVSSSTLPGTENQSIEAAENVAEAPLHVNAAQPTVMVMPPEDVTVKKDPAQYGSPFAVPFYSQFRDISSPKWQKVGCGITDLAMLIDFYVDDAPPVETLLSEGIALGAYAHNAGWTYQGLIDVAKRHGFTGSYYDIAQLSDSVAMAQLKDDVVDGPVIVSVHYHFDPKSTIPHLVVINGITEDTVYYNDPAAQTGNKTISVDDFLKAWKKRAVIIRPA